MTHLIIGTPMYGGLCQAAFSQSVTRLQAALSRAGQKGGAIYIGNESLIPRARNAIVWQFLQTPATHLLFCDADQGFRTPDVGKMIEADKPIICGPVPMKGIDWDKVAELVRVGVQSQELPFHASPYNVEFLEGEPTPVDEPFKIKRAGAGFMLIKREVFETIEKTCGVEHYDTDVTGLPEGAEVSNFFSSYVDEDEGRLLSEDYGFCDLAKRAGFDIWLAPWCEISHYGTYEFKGRFGR